MPFKSKAQARFMYARHPKIAKRWNKEYGVPKNLPEKLNINERIKRAKLKSRKS